MKLITLSEFVLKQSAKEWSATKRLNTIIAYAEFLNQPLKMEMFYPCENDEPLPFFVTNKWLEARKNVLFEGFYIKDNCLYHDVASYVDLENCKLNRIENMIYGDLELTKYALEKIGL